MEKVTFEDQLFENVTRPTHRGRRAGSGATRSRKYPFGTMEVGRSYKLVFKSDKREEQDKEVRAFRTNVLQFVNSHENINLKTWVVTAEQSAANHDPVEGAGIWVTRETDLTEAEVEKRRARRNKIRDARAAKKTAE